MAEKEYVEKHLLLYKILRVNSQVEQGIKYYNSVYNLVNEQPAADVVEVVRCKDCKLSSEPKSVSRLELYCNNYDVRFCEKEQKIVCGTHFCSHGTPKNEEEKNNDVFK